MKNEKITICCYGQYNYHNRPGIEVTAISGAGCETGVKCEIIRGDTYIITNHEYRRIRRHFCGIQGCKCVSGPEVLMRYRDGYKMIRRDNL
jgi:hypothetical protein